MSRYDAVAAVTATLKHVLEEAVRDPFPSCVVTTDRPESAAKGPEGKRPRINLYLFQVLPDPAFRNAAVPTYPSTGAVAQHPTRLPQNALDLHYLLSFFGDDPQLSGQQLLGIATATLHACAYLTPEVLRSAAHKYPWINESGLAQQPSPVRVAPLTLSFEDLSKFWSGFFQVPYTLSTTYQASVVLLDTHRVPLTNEPMQPLPPALPVAHPASHGAPGPLPQIDPHPTVSFRPHTRIVLRGKGLAGQGRVVRIGNSVVEPTDVQPASISFVLPDTVTVGGNAVQVGSRVEVAPGETRETFTSNTIELVVRRTIEAHYQRKTARRESPRIVVRAHPGVQQGQVVALDLTPKGEGAPFTASALVDADADEIVFPIPDVTAGKYFVQLEVDGVRSELAPDLVEVK